MDSLFSRLDAEWSRLAHDPQARADLEDVCSLAGVAALGDLTRFVRSANDADADRVLAALAVRSAAGSELAARALLQLLLPGTCRLAARWWVLGDAEERAACAIAAVYDRIRRYPIDRRPRKIAANVLLDANQDLSRAAREASRHAERTVPVDPRDVPYLGPVLEASAGDELCEVVADAVAAGIVRADDAELILATRVRGDCLPAVATRRGAKLRTLQWRRERAEAALVAAGAAA